MSGSVDPRLEEMLNGLLDGELTAAEEAEVRNRLERDRVLADRLGQLEACRTLLGSLPREEVPVELAERLREMAHGRGLPRQTGAFGAGPAGGSRIRGGRWVAVAAAVLLVGLLSVLARSIFRGPGGAPPMTASTATTEPGTPAVRSGPAAETLAGRLDLRVASLEDMGMFFHRTLENHGVEGVAVAGQAGPRRVYRLRCSPGVMEAVLADLAGSWHLFEESTLTLEAGSSNGPVRVASISPDQLAGILRQERPDMALEKAKETAVLNTVSLGMPSRDILAAVVARPNTPWPVVPKPVMTSGRGPVVERPEPEPGARLVDLTVVLDAGR
ncbi:MAG: hypothetical protein KBE04_01585 [Phycisphaerae bacterium]|nr:hypothetical protein [Phycisphaerae bacterium]